MPTVWSGAKLSQFVQIGKACTGTSLRSYEASAEGPQNARKAHCSKGISAVNYACWG